MTPEQAYNNLAAFVTQALGAGLFKSFESAAIAQEAIITIKKVIENGKEDNAK